MAKLSRRLTDPHSFIRAYGVGVIRGVGVAPDGRGIGMVHLYGTPERRTLIRIPSGVWGAGHACLAEAWRMHRSFPLRSAQGQDDIAQGCVRDG